jgi:hypothetical protein
MSQRPSKQQLVGFLAPKPMKNAIARAAERE